MKKEIRELLNKLIKIELGITYDEFELLDFDDQQRLIKLHRQNKKIKNNIVTSYESKVSFEDRLNNLIYSKPISFTKKLTKNIKIIWR